MTLAESATPTAFVISRSRRAILERTGARCIRTRALAQRYDLVTLGRRAAGKTSRDCAVTEGLHHEEPGFKMKIMNARGLLVRDAEDCRALLGQRAGASPLRSVSSSLLCACLSR